MDQVDQIRRAIALLSGLRDNLPDRSKTAKRWVDEYHEALDKASGALGVDLADFRLRDSDVGKMITGGNYVTGETRYSDDVFCDTPLLRQKLDSALKYLNLLLQPAPEKPRSMGFGQ